MESSDDGGGDPYATITKTALFVIIFLFAFHKPARVSFSSSAAVMPEPVVVSAKPAIKPVQATPSKKKKKKLYLTFDDGPNRGTKNVLHIMQDEKVPVTFFIVGEHVFASSSQGRMWDSLQMAREIELCNHSYSHAHNHYEKFYQEPDSVVHDFERSQDSLHFTNSIVRTPGRNIWRTDSIQFTDIKKSAAAADSLQKAGFIVMGWDLEWQFDHKTMSVMTTAEKMSDEIDSVFRKGNTKHPDHLVLLAHDQVYAKSADSFQLRQLIKLIKEKDEYELSLASAYPGAMIQIKDSIAVK
jgi:peptidoglycan/xylan/chitin deacetylase (PgdA/CDA1 family)